MKKGLLIIAILLGLIIFKDIPGVFYIIVDANTAFPSYVNNELDYITGVKIYNWTSTSAYTELSSTSVADIEVNNIQYSTISNSNISNFGNNGVSIATLLGDKSLITNSYYSTTMIICYTNNVTISFKEVYTGSGYADSFSHVANYSKGIISNNIDKDSFDSYPQNPSPNYCRQITYIYQPSKDGNILNTRLTSSDSLGWFYIVGQKTQYIGVADGLTTSQVNNVINNAIENSDLATATDIQSVNSAIEDLGTNIEDMTDDLIENQNENTQAQINAQKVCEYIDKNSIEKNNYFLSDQGVETANNQYGITGYIKVSQADEIKIVTYNGSQFYNAAFCFYNVNKELINCMQINSLSPGVTIIKPQGSNYFRSTIRKAENQPTYNICKNGNQAMMDADYNYNNNASETIEGQSDLDSMESTEENLMGRLDFSGANNVNITINPNASNFIWQIVENLRNMNSSIVLLWTSILGLGILKLILNR